jgi:tyrosyl-tRNA synthetase
MLIEPKEVLTIKTKRHFSSFFLGIFLGFTLSVGILIGIRTYAPQVAQKLMFPPETYSATEEHSQDIVQDFVRSTVQDILASTQGKAIVSNLLNNQSQETFERMFQELFQESMRSPEFRKALSDTLETFLESTEGKELLRRIAAEALNN